MCDYFLLTKPGDASVADNARTQIISLAANNVYILPKNNLPYYATHGLFESSLIEWCKQFCNKDKTVLDIGAHCGTYTVSLADRCKQVYAFEPQRMTYYALCGSVALSNAKNAVCLNVGLGDADQVGKQTLNIVSLDGGGSTLHAGGASVLQREEIEIRTLDSFGLDDVSFIKMDVEDNELHVLTGARATLRRCNYPKILFEMNTPNPKLISFVEGLGYAIVSIQGYGNMFLADHRR